jgi:hypothetical protein
MCFLCYCCSNRTVILIYSVYERTNTSIDTQFQGAVINPKFIACDHLQMLFEVSYCYEMCGSHYPMQGGIALNMVAAMNISRKELPLC